MVIRDIRVEVAELLVEFPVAVIAHLDDAVLNGECIAEVLPKWVVANFRGPAGEILAIEKGDPRSLSGGKERGREKKQKRCFH